MRAVGETDGFVEVVSGRESDRIPGVHILAPEAGDLISEAVLATEFCASSEDLARTCHAHPGLGEGLKETALAVGKRALHIQDRVRHARVGEESLRAAGRDFVVGKFRMSATVGCATSGRRTDL